MPTRDEPTDPRNQLARGDRDTRNRRGATCSRATARLHTRDETIEGQGEAGCRSRHADTVQVSRQMAAARALTDLAHQLFELAATDDAAACAHGHRLAKPDVGCEQPS